MPKKHQVPSLRDLALRSVVSNIIDLGIRLVERTVMLPIGDPGRSQSYQRMLMLRIRQNLSSTLPWHLFDCMALEILQAVNNRIIEIKKGYIKGSSIFKLEMNITANLIRIIAHQNLKRIEFSPWPKIMRYVLYKCMSDMTGLEVLDLGSGSAGWKTSDIEKIIVRAVSRMKNLTSFTLSCDCTDNVIAALARNCQKLQKVDVTASRSVTDRSIPLLLMCKQLKEVKLLSTSITPPGFAHLLLNHYWLEDIGRYDHLGLALEYICKRIRNFDEHFRLRVFECRKMNMRQLCLLVQMCPHIRSLTLHRDEKIDDLSILAEFTVLKELKLFSCNFYAHDVALLLRVIGRQIVSLHLEHVDEFDISALYCVSEFCPNLHSLVIYNCEFIATRRSSSRKLTMEPLKHLEKFKCVVECADVHLEYILSHCLNVRSIHLGSSTGICDATFNRILANNPLSKLEELKILYSNDLSMNSVRALMNNCKNLRRLSELENWGGISSEELRIFRQELKEANVDLDVRPILSLT